MYLLEDEKILMNQIPKILAHYIIRKDPRADEMLECISRLFEYKIQEIWIQTEQNFIQTEMKYILHIKK